MVRSRCVANVLLLAAVSLALLIPIEADARSKSKGRGNVRRAKVVHGSPPVYFFGDVQSVDSVYGRMTVKGKSVNSNMKDAPNGTVTFDVSGFTYIKEVDGSRVALADVLGG